MHLNLYLHLTSVYSSLTAKAIFLSAFSLAGLHDSKAAFIAFSFEQQPGSQAQQAFLVSEVFATVLATAFVLLDFGPQAATVVASALGAHEATFVEAALGAQVALVEAATALVPQEGLEAVEATFLQSEGLQLFKLAVLALLAFSPQKILHHSGEQHAGSF